jgi:hypothetical protein
MDAQITVKINDDLRHRVMRHASPVHIRGPIIWTSLFAATLTVLLVLYLEGVGHVDWSAPQTWLWVSVLPAMAGTLALLVFIRHRYNLAVEAIHSRWGEFEAVYHVMDEGIRYETPAACGLYPCKDFHRLVRCADMWLLYVDHANAIVLPTDRLGEDVREFLVRKVRECGGEVK